MLSLGGQAQGFFLGEHFERTGFFPVRSWRRRWLKAGRGAPPRTAEGRSRRGVARARAVRGRPQFLRYRRWRPAGHRPRRGAARLTRVAPDALELRAFRGTARRDGVLAAPVTRRSRARVNFAVR